MTTLLVSQGVPMILAGDELGRTQKGNNNAYCQDNEISWIDWDIDDRAKEILNFTRRIIHMRKEHPVLRRRKFFQGKPIFGGFKDLMWLQADGSEMTKEAWNKARIRSIGMMLVGDAMDELNEHGERIADDTLLVLLNASHEPTRFSLPKIGSQWQAVISTRKSSEVGETVESADDFKLEGRSAVVLRRMPG